ncbi:SH3 domain-containing protein [Devosia aurantiaca]|uniref:SH3 domain-containing protein n=1 Tax=Devosia aurantiaca TaxID=2714858 RepID=A0A6M1SM13_9HYPH|nr:SH3 domain-containing protein [Devosia aurantiaca]NGP18228.1 SH3 domain-containing protein [Devosia aurantiaca]
MIAPVLAAPITARVSGGTVAIYSGPSDRYTVIGYVENGTELPIDRCTQVDRESRFGGIADSGHVLSGADAGQWCRIPDYGWVSRNDLVGRGLVNVTPPDFSGPGW